MGIISFPLLFFGIITAIMAIVFGYKAKRAIAASGGRLAGGGKALAGRILGWVYVGIFPIMATVVLAAVVFVLVTNLSAEGDVFASRTVEIPPGDAWLQGFPVGEGATYRFEVNATSGVPVSASLRAVDDWVDPDIVPGDALWRQTGMNVGTTYTFAPGDYALVMVCEEAVACKVRYRVIALDAAAPTSSSTMTSPPRIKQAAAAPDIPAGCPALPAQGNSNRLLDWEPDSQPAGNSFIVEADPGADFGEGHRVYRQQDHGFDDDVGGNGFSIRSYTADYGYAWTLHLVLPEACRLQAGTFYPSATSEPGTDLPRLEMIVDDVQCSEATSSFVIDSATLDPAGNPTQVVMRIEFHCQREEPAAMAKLVWSF